jgi:2-iminobutanoate/2-iminopropanoate deaminase
VHRIHAPTDIAAPVAPSYSLAVEVAPNARWLAIAGQVGNEPDGTVAEGAGPQADRAWGNIVALLEAAGMGLEDLVKVTTYITDPAFIPALREVRARFQVEGYRPASTLVVVVGLAAPEYLVEIEAFAARA